MSNLQAYYHFKLDLQKVDQHTSKWLIHGAKRHRDNQLQIMELPCRMSGGRNIQEVVHLQNQNYM